MPNTKNKALLQQLKQKIRNEANRRIQLKTANKRNAFGRTEQKHTLATLLEMTKGSQVYGRENDHSDHHDPATLRLNLPRFTEPVIFERKNSYVINDFLKHHDVYFVRNAYIGLLDREPDTGGLQYYLHCLRDGNLTKIEILGRIRFSKEGRTKSKKVQGLIIPLITQTAYRPPVFGYLFQMIIGLFRLPVFIHNFQRFEAYNNWKMMEINSLINEGYKQIEQNNNLFCKKISHLHASKSEQKEVMELHEQFKAVRKEAKKKALNLTRQIQNVDRQKASHHTIDLLHQMIQTLTDSKADRQSIDLLEQQLQTQNQTKADLKDIAEIRKILSNQNQTKADLKDIAEIRSNLSKLDTRKSDKLTYPDLEETWEVSAANYIDHAIKITNIPVEHFDMFNKTDLHDVLFQAVFRDISTIKKKLPYYLSYINKKLSKRYPFLDAGCGRGEFLDILRNANIDPIGIDINTLDVAMLKEAGNQVYNEDILHYLSRTDQKFSGISAFQVIEHLDYKYLKGFLEKAFEKIETEGVIILETVNSHSSYALSNFYLDMTHQKPLPPELMKFLLEWTGFKDVKTLYSSPLPEPARFFPEKRMNYQDYAVIGYKR